MTDCNDKKNREEQFQQSESQLDERYEQDTVESEQTKSHRSAFTEPKHNSEADKSRLNLGGRNKTDRKKDKLPCLYQSFAFEDEL